MQKPLASVLVAALGLGVLGCGGGDDGDETPVGDPAVGWGQEVDEFWGDAPGVDTRLALFDLVWGELDESFAMFEALELDWDQVRTEVRPTVEQAGSYGRMYAELKQMVASLRDYHTYLGSDRICGTPRSQRPPAYFLTSVLIDAFESDGSGLPIDEYDAPLLGACVTPHDGDGLLVYLAQEGNPAGLQPGDVILGYDGKPWAANVADIEEANLPMCGFQRGNSSAREALRLESVVDNPHLFTSLDLRRADGSLESIPTDGLLDFSALIECSDQLDVPGVDKPWTDYTSDFSNRVTWGQIDGTNIGYIYIYSWSMDGGLDISEKVVAALQALQGADGLIVDLRLNYGGYVSEMQPVIDRLFDQDLVHVLGERSRVSGSPDRCELGPTAWSDFVVDPATNVDVPIAVLTGPRTLSAGELFAYLLTHHPRARTFGRPCNGSIGKAGVEHAPEDIVGDLSLHRAWKACVDADEHNLHNLEREPDETVLLSQADVRQGVDSVVAAAQAWIEAQQ
jgi:C-terminal processing protease CtpA/Prc